MDQRYRVLMVCTGNICRSPAAAAWMTALADQSVDVASAGTAAVVGAPVQPSMAGLMQREGLRIEDFAARQLTPGLIRQADLVLGMTTGHRRWVVGRAPAAVRRTFTLIEFARLAQLVDANAGGAYAASGETRGSSAHRLRGVVAAVPSVRGRLHLGRHHDDSIDVPDPYGRDEDAYELAFSLIRDAMRGIVG